MNDQSIISWKVAGIALGLLLTLATFLVKPLGVSTQFVVTDAMMTHQVAPAFAENNAYLSQYGEQLEWGIGYGWMLILGMIVGGGVTAALFRKQQPPQDQGSMPAMWGNAIRFFKTQTTRRRIYRRYAIAVRRTPRGRMHQRPYDQRNFATGSEFVYFWHCDFCGCNRRRKTPLQKNLTGTLWNFY